MKTRRWSALGVSCLLVGGLLSCGENRPDGFVESNDGFGMVAPENWNWNESPSGASLVLWRGERDSASPTISVVTVDLPPEATHRNFYEFNLKDAAAQDGYVPIRTDTALIDGDSVTLHSYAYRIEGRFRQGLLTGLVGEERSGRRKGYVILCSTENGKLEGMRPTFMRILSTFQRLDS